MNNLDLDFTRGAYAPVMRAAEIHGGQCGQIRQALMLQPISAPSPREESPLPS